MTGSCRTCKYRHDLWYWDEHGKQYGNCCTFFKDTGEDVVMQLTALNSYCEEFVKKEIKEVKKQDD